jgi:hypothetical protein
MCPLWRLSSTKCASALKWKCALQIWNLPFLPSKRHQQLRSRIVEAERLIAEAKADLLAGRQPDPNAALQSLIIDDLRQQQLSAGRAAACGE